MAEFKLSRKIAGTMVGKLTAAQAHMILEQNIFGHIGCNDGVNTYIFPTNYIFDGKHIICHSQKGAKILVMQRNPIVCFQVDEVKDFVHWKSVMVIGEYQELKGTRERYNAMKLFTAHMLHLKTAKQEAGRELQKNMMHPDFTNELFYVIYRVVVNEITARYEDGY